MISYAFSNVGYKQSLFSDTLLLAFLWNQSFYHAPGLQKEKQRPLLFFPTVKNSKQNKKQTQGEVT